MLHELNINEQQKIYMSDEIVSIYIWLTCPMIKRRRKAKKKKKCISNRLPN